MLYFPSFPARLDFPTPPLSAPGSPRMQHTQPETKCRGGGGVQGRGGAPVGSGPKSSYPASRVTSIFLDKSCPTYLGKIEATLLAG